MSEMVAFFVLFSNLSRDYEYFCSKLCWWKRLFCGILVSFALIASFVCIYAYRNYTLDEILAAYISDNVEVFDLITVYAVQWLMVLYDVIVYDFDALWLIIHPIVTLFIFWSWMVPIYAVIHLIRIERLTTLNSMTIDITKRTSGTVKVETNVQQSSSVQNTRICKLIKSVTEQNKQDSHIVNKVQYLCMGLMGIVSGVLSLCVFVLYVIFGGVVCGIGGILFECMNIDGSEAFLVRSREYYPCYAKPKWFWLLGWIRYKMTGFVCQLRIKTIRKGGQAVLGGLSSVLIGIYQIVDCYCLRKSDNFADSEDDTSGKLITMVNSLANRFGDYFPCFFGIGVANRDQIIKLLTQKNMTTIKDKWFRFGHVSSFIANYSDYSLFFLSSNDEKYKIGKRILHEWLLAFDLDKIKRDTASQDFSLLYNFNIMECGNKNTIQQLLSQAVKNNESTKFTSYITQCFGSLFYCLGTGQTQLRMQTGSILGKTSQTSQTANGGNDNTNSKQIKIPSVIKTDYVSLISSPFYMFNDWIQWFLFGDYFIRKQKQYYDNIYLSFLSNVVNCNDNQGPLSKVYDLYARLHQTSSAELEEKAGSMFDLGEAFKLLVVAFNISSVAPVNLLCLILKKLYTDPVKYMPLWERSNRNFILEICRLNPGVPIVTVFSNTKENINIGGKDAVFPSHTPFQCCLNIANRDPDVFTNPNEFDVTRDNLDQILTFNGFMDGSGNGRASRICPGIEFTMVLVEYIVNALKPSHPIETSPKSTQPIAKIGENVQHCGSDHDDTKSDSNCTKWKFVKKLFDLDWFTMSFMAFVSLDLKLSPKIDDSKTDIIKKPCLVKDNEWCPAILAGKPLLKTDEDYDLGRSIISKVAYWAILKWFQVVNAVYQLVDSNRYKYKYARFETANEGVAWRKRFFGNLTTSDDKDESAEMVSDEAMSRLAFSSMCCHYTKKITKDNSGTGARAVCPPMCPKNAVFVSDFSTLFKFKVRNGYEKYGAVAYFDENYEIIGIYWCHQRRFVAKFNVNNEHTLTHEDVELKQWNHAKWVWKTSWFVYVTLVDHLYFTHFYCGNGLATCVTKHLPPSHCLRIFLKPFIFGTINKNNQAIKSLVNKYGIVHQLFGFPYSELLNVLNEAKNKFTQTKYKIGMLKKPIGDVIIDSSMINYGKHIGDKWDSVFPIKKDLDEFFSIVYDYVATFIKVNHANIVGNDKYVSIFVKELCKYLEIELEFEEKEKEQEKEKQIINLLSWLIVAASGLHEHFGYTANDVLNPQSVGTKLEPNHEMCSVQNYSQLLSLVAVTCLDSPKMTHDWSYLIDDERDLILYKQFLTNLRKLSKTIKERNNCRHYSLCTFDPTIASCSSSI